MDNRKLRLLARLRPFLFISLIVFSPIFSELTVNVLAPYQPKVWLVLLVSYALVVWTHREALKLTREAVYLFGFAIERNPMMRRILKTFGFGKARYLTYPLPLLVLLEGPELAAIGMITIFFASSFDWLNDWFAIRTYHWFLTGPDQGVPSKLFPVGRRLSWQSSSFLAALSSAVGKTGGEYDV